MVNECQEFSDTVGLHSVYFLQLHVNVNLFHGTGIFLYTLEKQISREYGTRTVA